MQYRTATEYDLDAICELTGSAIISMENKNIFQWDSLYPTRDDFLEDIKKGELFVGLLGENIAVIYTLNKECDEEYQNGEWKYLNSNFCVLHRLCVHPKYQNQGIAGRTLVHIETELKKKHFDSIRLDVFSNNPAALKLYSNRGYQNVGFADWRKGRFFLLEKHL